MTEREPDVFLTVSQRVLDEFAAIEQVTVPYRLSVHPEKQLALLDKHVVPLIALAGGLGVRAQVVGAYEMGDNGPTGRYTETGRQEIADALGKGVLFAPQTDQFSVDPQRGTLVLPQPPEAA